MSTRREERPRRSRQEGFLAGKAANLVASIPQQLPKAIASIIGGASCLALGLRFIIDSACCARGQVERHYLHSFNLLEIKVRFMASDGNIISRTSYYTNILCVGVLPM